MKALWLDSSADVDEFADEVVRRTSEGELVLLPTETQYGLCCNAGIARSVERLNRIKKRSLSVPSAVFVRDWSHGAGLAKSAPHGIERFLSHFWPGALTIILSSSRPHWPGIVSPAGSVGLRCSSHPLLIRIQSLSPVYLTATSANRHGEPPTTDPESLTNWLAEDIELFIFDHDIREDAPASTIIDVTASTPRILRIGEISEKRLLKAWQEEIVGAGR